MPEPQRSFHLFGRLPTEIQIQIFEHAGSRGSTKPPPGTNDLMLSYLLGDYPPFDDIVRVKAGTQDTRLALFETSCLARQVVLEQWKEEIKALNFEGVGAEAPHAFYLCRLNAWKEALLERLDYLLDNVRNSKWVRRDALEKPWIVWPWDA